MNRFQTENTHFCLYHFQKFAKPHGVYLQKATSASTLDTGSKHLRSNSATRYAQVTQKQTISKAQSVEEIRKKNQVKIPFFYFSVIECNVKIKVKILNNLLCIDFFIFDLEQAVVDEKKKKQDEKLRKAQQLREAQDKEKSEKQRKLLMVSVI